MSPRPEKDVSLLLAGLRPSLQTTEYVFCSVPKDKEQTCWSEGPLATFREEEGLSVVLAKSSADRLGFPYDSVHRCISLRVFSSLEAVGLTAAISTRLAEAEISANVIAATHHDHVLVRTSDAERALRVLQHLSEASATRVG